MGENGVMIDEEVMQSLCIKSNIDKANGKVYFEAMVTFPETRPDTYSYTKAEFGYNFSTSTLIDCRFLMTWADQVYLDMMLTSDGRYLWYETETRDDFGDALEASMVEFNNECATVTKLTGNFNAEMQAYVDDLTQATTNPGQPGQPGGSGDGNEGGGVIEEETMKPTNPPQEQTFIQVNQEDWTKYLEVDKLPDYHLDIRWNNDAITYTVDGEFVSVSEARETLVLSQLEYMVKDGVYYLVTTIMQTGETSRVEITEDEYNQAMNKARINFALVFEYDSFEYSQDLNCYYLEEIASLEISQIEIRFIEGALSRISLTKNGVRYDITLSFIK